jgi:hypothetical protein
LLSFRLDALALVVVAHCQLTLACAYWSCT